VSRVTIVVADDHQVVRIGLRALLEAEPDFEIVGEATDGLEAVQLVERLQPNLLVLDLMMPRLNGLEVSRQVSQHVPQTRIVVLSMHADEVYVAETLTSGVSGYVLKQSGTTDLVSAVREVMAGRRYLSPPLSERAIEAYVRYWHASRDETLDLYETLTPREREVLCLAAQGYSNAQMAEQMFISARTVETHRANMMHKLGLRSPVDLVRYAIQRGILPEQK
jgi:two-component system response regulator NreC